MNADKYNRKNTLMKISFAFWNLSDHQEKKKHYQLALEVKPNPKTHESILWFQILSKQIHIEPCNELNLEGAKS